MKQRQRRRITSRKVFVGIARRRLERAQAVITDAFMRWFKGDPPAKALRDAVFDAVMRPAIRRLVDDLKAVLEFDQAGWMHQFGASVHQKGTSAVQQSAGNSDPDHRPFFDFVRVQL